VKYKIEKLLINRQAFFVLQAVLGKFAFFAFHKAKEDQAMGNFNY